MKILLRHWCDYLLCACAYMKYMYLASAQYNDLGYVLPFPFSLSFRLRANGRGCLTETLARLQEVGTA
jgi:hypothetical protein